MYADLNSAPGCVCCAFVYILTYWQRRQDNTPRQTICTGWSSRLLIPSLLVWAAGIVFNLFVIPQNWFRLAKKKSRHEIDQKRTQPANLTTATETNNISMISPHNLTSQSHLTTSHHYHTSQSSQSHITNAPHKLTLQSHLTTLQHYLILRGAERCLLEYREYSEGEWCVNIDCIIYRTI